MDDETKCVLRCVIRDLKCDVPNEEVFDEAVRVINPKHLSVNNVFDGVCTKLDEKDASGDLDRVDALTKVHVAGAIINSNVHRICSDNDKLKLLSMLIRTEDDMHYNMISYNYLNDLLQKVDFTEFKRSIFPRVESKLAKSWEEQTLDSLYLLMVVQKTFPESMPVKFLENNLGTADIVCPESLTQLCNMLTKIPKTLDLKHPLFEILLTKLVETDLVEQFFTQLDRLMTFDPTQYTTYTILLTAVLERLKDPKIIPNFFTKKYFEASCLSCNSVVLSRDVQILTEKLFDALSDSLEKYRADSETLIQVFVKILSVPGSFNKSILTGVRENILRNLEVEGVKKLGAICRAILETRDVSMLVDLYCALDVLEKLILHPKMSAENDWKIEQIMCLGKICLLKDQIDGLSNLSAEIFGERFFCHSFDMQGAKLDDIRYILSRVFDEFAGIMSDDKREILRKSLKQKDHETWKKTVDIVRILGESSLDKDIIFHVLFSYLGLLLLKGSKMAAQCLSEVFSCYDSIKDTRCEEDDPGWIEIVDLFLTLLSYDSDILQTLVTCVFPIVCKYFNSDVSHQFFYILDPLITTMPLPAPARYEFSPEESEEEDDDDQLEEEYVPNEQEMEEDASSSSERWSDEDFSSDDPESDEENFTPRAFFQMLTSFEPNGTDTEALTKYRCRILKLIGTYLEHNPAMLQTLEMISPLMRLLQFCVGINGQEGLFNEIKRCLKQLASLQCNESEDVTEEYLFTLLGELYNKDKLKSRIVEKMMTSMTHCGIFILNCSQLLDASDAGTSKTLNELMRQALTVFLIRNCTIPYDFVKELFLRPSWKLIHTCSLVPVLTQFILCGYTSPERRNFAVELAKLFFKNRQYIDSHREELKSTEEEAVKFLKESVGFLENFNGQLPQIAHKFLWLKDDYLGFYRTKDNEQTQPFICSLLELLCDIKNSGLAENFGAWTQLGTQVRVCCSSVTLPQHAVAVFRKFWESTEMVVVEGE